MCTQRTNTWGNAGSEMNGEKAHVNEVSGIKTRV
jgi:hypothetical protein